ncbi:hypothetical protein A3860_10900 [Niastella vici]|uniref:Uncharacterized protein n=1 Tax=Niastella vici TaxID=1703345 RepID=A0A1V9FFK2_9BACT|nr:hypothetical protein [Niastella vici]OQP57067.1 hypothetical protein A3860_10900 [Niastella vici]
MAEVFAPFIINRTMHNLTFYSMAGRNFVRTKSSLTKKRVLRSPEFERTRYHAGLLAKASRIGSLVYNELPEYWRQGWMYRSFTGEAYTMLKVGKSEQEIQQVLLQRYVEEVASKQLKEPITAPLHIQPKRPYRKSAGAYWRGKTIKRNRRKAHQQKLLYNAGLLARASKLGSKLYAHVSSRYKCRRYYQQLTAWAMQLLKEEWHEADILAVLLPAVREKQVSQNQQPAQGGLVIHPNGQYYFITPLYKRFDFDGGQLLYRSSAPVASHSCAFGSLFNTKKAPPGDGAVTISYSFLLDQ